LFPNCYIAKELVRSSSLL